MDCVRIRPAMGNWPEALSSLLAAPVAVQMSAPEAEALSERLLQNRAHFALFAELSARAAAVAEGGPHTLVGSFPGCYVHAVSGHPAAARGAV